MSTLTAAQKSQSNAAEFRKKFAVLHRAAVGVVIVRTHEPHRLIENLRAFAWAERETMDFRSWSSISGWARVDREKPSDPPQIEPCADPSAAIQKVLNPPGTQGGFPNGIYTMLYPHQSIDKALQLVQWVKEASVSLTQVRKRLVLITPPGYTVPIELQTDVPLLDFDLPAYSELREGFQSVVDSVEGVKTVKVGGKETQVPKRPVFSEDEIDMMLAAGAGLTMHEFVSTMSRAIMTHFKALPDVSAETLAGEIMKVKTEAVKRTDVLEVMPAEDMANVGGLDVLKDWVAKRKACFTQAARDFGIDSLKGVLMAGPPGTGKSLMSKAIAHELALPLIRFDVSRVFASLVGQSEERVAMALKMVEAMAPCVLQVDEVDKALGGTHTGGGDSGVGKRVLGKILTWLQESQSSVFTVFTANRVTELPSELLRRGRLDQIFSVGLPDSDERLEVVKIHLRKRGHDPDTVPNLNKVVEKEGYVPAELEGAVKDALIESFTSDVPLTGELIASQLDYMVPLSEAFRDDFEAMAKWARENAMQANGKKPQRPTRTRHRPPVSGIAGARRMDMDG